MKNTLPALVSLIAALAFIPSPVKAATAISTLGSATATNTFDNVGYQQEWTWNSLSVGDGLILSTTSTANAGGNGLLTIQMTGANSNSHVDTYAINAFDEHSGTTSTNFGITGTAANGTHNYGVQGQLDSSFGGNAGDAAVWGNAAQSTGANYGIYGTNASATGYAGYFNNSNGGYAAAFMGGKVGIGTATPANSLDINGAAAFGSYAGTAAPSNSVVVSGDVGIGTTSAPSFTSKVYTAGVFINNNNVSLAANNSDGIDIQTSSGSGKFAQAFFDGTTGVGSIVLSTSATSFNTTSDKRLKEHVAAVANSGALIDAMTPVTFDWTYISGHPTGTGFLAQDLYAVFPDAVTVGDNGSVDKNGHVAQQWSVDYSKLVPVTVAELKSLRARVAADEAAIAAMKAKLGMQ